ncbi:SRPBCC family protein [Nocardioides sp.]|uniref:SRPBCC family protein n=1 Tax=Nocardioides sp. TaxID=35761 RepID=UPI002C856D1B|nr:SRPBCC family protein [Nocardioides sp.]HXH81066.1 SRPBCC family protein [Nocardioides sp.]
MATGSFTIDIARPAHEITDFILDVGAYQEIDPRLRSIRWVRRAPDCTVFRFRPSLMGLPAPLTTQMVTRRDDVVEIISLPGPADAMVDFVGRLECRPGDGITAVTRTLTFTFASAVRWLLDSRLESWLATDVEGEMRRLKSVLERTDRESAVIAEPPR